MAFRRIAGLYRRFVAANLSVARPGFPLCDPKGTVLGYLDAVTQAGDRTILHGWAVTRQVGLVCGGQPVPVRTGIRRDDVARAVTGSDPHPGFEGQLSGDGPAFLTVGIGDGTLMFPLPRIAEATLRRARRALVLPFLARLLRQTPSILAWRLRGSAPARDRLARVFGLPPAPLPERVLASGLFGAAANRPTSRAPITIILPVYNALDLLTQALARVERHTDLPWHLVIVEDCSTDPALRPWLRGWTERLNRDGRARVTLIENAANLGFIGSVNRALGVALDRGHHVVLLNSDALVPAGWASRLLRPILEDARVASVTPLSNDGEIVSVPLICRAAALTEGEAEALDGLAQRFAPRAVQAETPTGVGFCMAVNRAFLARLPQLDTAFGRGYGEEVDWCRRALALGGRHVVAGDLFVEHRGGSSFGGLAKRDLVRANNALISARYPGYDRAVQDLIRADPLITPRLALAIALAARRAGTAPVPLFIAHSLGGGAEAYLADRIRRLLGDGLPGAALVLRVGGAQRWRLELHLPDGVVAGATSDFGLILRLLRPAAALRIIYSNGVGDCDPVSLPDHILRLKRTAADTVEVLIHDYLPLSPSYTLLDDDGRYRGVPAADDGSAAHRARRPDGRIVPLADWRAAWGRLLAEAGEIVVFSRDSADRVREAYPQAAARLRIVPHRLIHRPEPVHTPSGAAAPVIGVLGNIGVQKGIAVVAALGRRLERTGAARIVVIGNVDPACPLAGPVQVHGSYSPAEVSALAARYGITCWLIPSIWPETFSYTTHEALATGLPVWCFDLGAQAEAVHRARASGAAGGVIGIGDAQDAGTLHDRLVPVRHLPRGPLRAAQIA